MESVSFLEGYSGLTEKIRRAMYDVCRQFVYIGFLLEEADRNKYYEEHGFSSIYEYASVELGFKRSSTKNFIAIARTFCEPTRYGNLSMHLRDQYEKFNYSQLVEMLSMSEGQRAQVRPDSTVKEIRALKASGQTSGQSVDVVNLNVSLSPELYSEITTYLCSSDSRDIFCFIQDCTRHFMSQAGDKGKVIYI